MDEIILKLFSGPSINTSNNTKLATNKEIELTPIAKKHVTNYGSLLKNSTKDKKTTKIAPFSLCPTPSNYFQQKLANLNNEQVEESKPRISTGK